MNRLNCRQHNTLTVNDKDHNVPAFVKMTAVENSKERMTASFDLTPLFDGDLIKAERTAAICDGSYLEIRDKLATPSDRPAKVRWTIVTEGKPEVTSDSYLCDCWSLSDLFADLVLVTFAAVARYHLAYEAGKEELEAKNHGQERKIEQRLVCYRTEIHAVALLDEFLCNHPYCEQGACKEHQYTGESEEMHRLLAKTA